MSKIFEFRPGSYIDPISGAVGVNSNGAIERTEKGLAWKGNGVDSKIAITETTYNIHTGAYTFEFWQKRVLTTIKHNPILANTSTSGYRILSFIGNYIRIETDTNGDVATSSTFPIDTDWHHYLVICNAGIVSMYRDGVEITMVDDTITDAITFNLIGIADTVYINDGHIGRIQIYDHALTPEERAKLFSDFLRATPITKSIF